MYFTAKPALDPDRGTQRHKDGTTNLVLGNDRGYTNLVPGSDRGYTKGGTKIFLTTGDTGDTDSFPLCKGGKGDFERGGLQRSPNVNRIGIVFPEFRLVPSLGVAGKYISLSKIQD